MGSGWWIIVVDLGSESATRRRDRTRKPKFPLFDRLKLHEDFVYAR